MSSNRCFDLIYDPKDRFFDPMGRNQSNLIEIDLKDRKIDPKDRKSIEISIDLVEILDFDCDGRWRSLKRSVHLLYIYKPRSDRFSEKVHFFPRVFLDFFP